MTDSVASSLGNTGHVVGRHEWAPGLVTLTVDATTAPFEAGQFVNLGLLLDGELVSRSYSVASAPGGPLEFYLTEVASGRLTPHLCRLPVGAPLHVDPKPQGFFTLKWLPDAARLWLMATGTGLGPYMALLRAGEVFRRFDQVILVHGVRDAAQLGYRSELEALTAERPAFRYVPALSRSPAPGIGSGRVTALLASGELERSAGARLDAGAHVMLCGNPAMIAETEQLLARRGLRKHRQRKPGHITVEKYW